MTRLEAVLRDLAAALDALDVGWALVGGLAVSARTEPRFTRDVDVAVAVTGDAAAEAVVHGLMRRGYRPETVIQHRPTGRMATVRLQPPPSGPRRAGIVVDLLFASCGIEPEVVASATRLEVLPSLRAPVARAGHLVAMKLLSRAKDRPLDEADLRALLEGADAGELRRARRAVTLIQRRGFNRRRNLVRALDRATHRRGS